MTPKTWAPWAAAVISVAVGAAAWSWRTGAVGGSDSACYALMAQVFADGAWQPMSVLATRRAVARGVARGGARLGSCPRPSARPRPCRYARRATRCSSRRLSALLVQARCMRCRQWPPRVWCGVHSCWPAGCPGRPSAGVAASLLVATTPIVMFQAVQPMNDITTGALWAVVALAMSAGRPAATGASGRGGVARASEPGAWPARSRWQSRHGGTGPHRRWAGPAGSFAAL